jgi:hypothetical protein
MSLESTGGETGHMVRANVRQRFGIFNVTANYTLLATWADSTPNPGDGPSDSYNLRSDWSRSGFPLQQFNGSLNARLPLGFFLTGIVNTSTGRRYTVTTGKDDNKDTLVNDRPVGVPRNSLVGPRQLRFDFNISKAIFLGASTNGTSRTNVNLFANMTNAFNRPNLGTPSGVMTSSNFGKSTSASDPREIEVGLRFQF